MFTIPNLPTDNLYKFKVIGGFTLATLALYIYFAQVDKAFSNLWIQKQNIIVFTNQIDYYSDLIKKLENESKNFKGKIDVKSFNDSLRKKTYREYADFMIKNKIVHLNNDDALVFFVYDKEIEIIQEKLRDADTKLKLRESEMRFDNLKLLFSSILMCIIAFYAESLIRKGFKEWLFKVQIPLDKKLNQEISDNNEAK